MRQFLRFCLTPLIAVLLASCSDTTGTGISDSSAPTPRAFFSNAPLTSGPNVQRGVPLAVVAVDVETNLVLVAGFADPITEANCEHPENIPLSGDLTQQQVSTPSGREQFTTPRQEVEVTIYQLVEEPTSFCSLFSGPIVAAGTVTATWGEKNVPPPGDLGPGAGIVHIIFNGVVDLSAGGEARLLGGFRARFNNDGEFVTGIDFVRLK
jgi:hypothetical protein